MKSHELRNTKTVIKNYSKKKDCYQETSDHIQMKIKKYILSYLIIKKTNKWDVCNKKEETVHT